MVKYSRQAGVGLVQVVIYVALLAILSTTIISYAIQFIKRNADAQEIAQVSTDARIAMDVMTREIRQASGIYGPVSTFGANPSQLSLATTQNLPTDENETYVEFYLDDERLYRKREEQAAELITPERTVVTNLIFTHLNQASSAPAVQINLTLTPDTSSVLAAARGEITLVGTASLRSY